MYIFDEYDEYFRCPGGAITAPGKLKLRLKFLRATVTSAYVFYRPDGGQAAQADMRAIHAAGSYDVFECELDFSESGLYWYHFLADTADGTLSIPEHEGGAFQVTVHVPSEESPDWIHGGVIYHIFVDRFFRGGELNLRPGAVFREDWGGCPYFAPDETGIVKNNDFFGGDLYGIIEKLTYLEKLGVTCIYLSPVFEAASNHKYDTGDYMRIDPSFGGDEAFSRLCKAAGERGIRVILDGVFNHVGSDSLYFNRYGTYEGAGAHQGKQSPYRGWFSFREDGTYDSWWGIELLPALDKNNEGYRDFICGKDGVIAHWMKKGVSGWRLDVVDELPDVFLDPLCEAIKRDNKSALIVGEVWEDASNKISYDVRRRYFLGGQLDSVTNYPLKDAIIAFVKDGDAPRLAHVMDAICQNYPKNVQNSLMNILGTHDTMRILTALGGTDFPNTKAEMADFRLTAAQLAAAKARLKLASLLQFTLPGVPCVYYGDEAGMQGGADPFNRRCYPWGNEDGELISWYSYLSGLRREHSCLRDGGYSLVQARGRLFAFTRTSGASRILAAVNVSDSDITLETKGFDYDLLENKKADELVVKSGNPAVYTAIDSRGQ